MVSTPWHYQHPCRVCPPLISTHCRQTLSQSRLLISGYSTDLIVGAWAINSRGLSYFTSVVRDQNLFFFFTWTFAVVVLTKYPLWREDGFFSYEYACPLWSVHVAHSATCYWKIIPFALYTTPLLGQVEVEVNLRPTVSRPVCLGVRRPSGTCGQFRFLLEISFRQLRVCYFVAPSLTRGLVCNLL
jgi:hypothetical protein